MNSRHEEFFDRNGARRIKATTSSREGSAADRIKAMLLSDDGWSYRVSEAPFLDEVTVSKHVDEYRTQQKLSIQTGGLSSKLSREQESELAEHLKSKTYLKVAEICDVARTYSVHYTVVGMTYGT